ncbi:MAG: Na+/H+-dicarboxylate symporter [Alphaproteobacteria bacterium]|jgi:Na+/H+-dicarboxylate symporter
MSNADLHPIARIHPRPLKYLGDAVANLVHGRLWLKVLIGMALGLAVGIAIGPTMGWVPPRTAATAANWLAFPGQLFLTLVQMIVIPLVFASIIRGLAATEGIDQLRRLGSRVVFYFIGTTTVAIIIGLVIASLIRPGQFIDPSLVSEVIGAGATKTTAAAAAPGMTLHSVPNKLLALLPSNPLATMVQAEMMGVVIFSIIVGIALVTMKPDQSRPMLDLLGSLQQVCMTIVAWAMRLAPYAVFGLMAQLTAKIGLEALFGMAMYVLTVMAGLGALFIFHIGIVVVVAKRRPLAYLIAVREVLLLAFSTSSSAAVMPMSLRTAEDKLKIRPSVAQFIIPVGATINMDGTAMYQGIAAMFLAQVFGIDIGIEGMALVVLTAVGASIGTPATPGVGIVILSMVLTTVNVPPAGIALIMGVDRLLDMCRTAINVNGDLVAASVMDRWIGSSRSLTEERVIQAEHQAIRERTGSDTVVRTPEIDA